MEVQQTRSPPATHTGIWTSGTPLCSHCIQCSCHPYLHAEACTWKGGRGQGGCGQGGINPPSPALEVEQSPYLEGHQKDHMDHNRKEHAEAGQRPWRSPSG